MDRRGFLTLLLSAASVGVVGIAATEEVEARPRRWRRLRRRRLAARKRKPVKLARKTRGSRRSSYAGARIVDFPTQEKVGTIIIRTSERALYRVMGGGKAKRYLVAVGKEGFSWSGTARVGMKAVNPRWTPPPEMIERTPRFAKWAGGMPGGIPENPLGARALYLYKGGRDTQFRIHGTNAPWSIGTAASSGCIRMLNHEVIDLYNMTPRGTKVIVM